jgi:hypothetical protein
MLRLFKALSLELGKSGSFSLYAVYVRAEACLVGHQGRAALTEFQKILDHRGVVVNELIGSATEIFVRFLISSIRTTFHILESVLYVAAGLK